MIHIQVDRQYWLVVRTPEIRHAARVAAALAGLPADADFSIVITGDEAVRSLNAEFRHVNETTDVLSFPSSENDPESGKGYAGDIIISHPRAQKQAEETGHPVHHELILLVVHGVLHLAGFDHLQAGDEKKMFDLQNEALNRLNIKIAGFNA